MSTTEGVSERLPTLVTSIDRLKQKKEPSLGELNPLLFPPDLANPEAVEALVLVIRREIQAYGGVQPTTLESTFAHDSWAHKQVPRLVAKFELSALSAQQINLLERVVRQTYGRAVRSRHDNSNRTIPPYPYPELDQRRKPKVRDRREEKSRLLGWYVGPDMGEVLSTNMGVFIYRDLGEVSMADYLKSHDFREWFFKDDLTTPWHKVLPTKYIVEMREANLYQTDMVELVTQIAVVLAGKEPLDQGSLKYEVYNSLNRLGIKRTGRYSIYGLDEQIALIERVLILPLANLGLSSGIDFQPASVLGVGVPGTGKTLVAEYLLQQDTGVFILPVDALDLARELFSPPEKKMILPRISAVFNQTQIPVVLHIDDIEHVAKGGSDSQPALLNLMAGIRESGFYVLASTNHPEEIDPRLLQPQRFAHLVYFPLPTTEVRRGILDIHATQTSLELGIPLFASDVERGVILRAAAEHTDGFTSRFLAEVCTQAKSFLLQRIALARGRRVGLTESDLMTYFTSDDWMQAYVAVSQAYDREGVQKRDREIRKFVQRIGQRMGFNQGEVYQLTTPFQRAISEGLAAAQKEDMV